jgi:hypothetical protein
VPTITYNTDRPDRDGWVMAGMLVAAASAAVASFTGLRGLALVSGWPLRLAWLLPVTLDAYAMTSARVWLATTTRTRRARRFARANAIGAISASIAGNATYHSVAAGLLRISPPIVVLVGAVPAAVLGLTAHLHALRTLAASEDGTESDAESAGRLGQDGAESGSKDRTDERLKPRPRTAARRKPKSRTEDELIAEARQADAAYRAAHGGRPITRDELRKVLAIAGPRATELRRRLAAESEQSEPPAGTAPVPDAEPHVADRKEALTA